MGKRILGLTLCSCPMWSGGIGPFSLWQFKFCVPECVSSLLRGGSIVAFPLCPRWLPVFNDQLYFLDRLCARKPFGGGLSDFVAVSSHQCFDLSSRCFSMRLAKLDAAFGDRHSFHFSGGGEVLYVRRDETSCTEQGDQQEGVEEQLTSEDFSFRGFLRISPFEDFSFRRLLRMSRGLLRMSRFSVEKWTFHHQILALSNDFISFHKSFE